MSEDISRPPKLSTIGPKPKGRHEASFGVPGAAVVQSSEPLEAAHEPEEQSHDDVLAEASPADSPSLLLAHVELFLPL